MSPGHPLTHQPPPAGSPLSRVSRWKLDEPVRFYLWPALALMLAALVADVGFLVNVSLRSAALVLLLLAVEAARMTHAATLRVLAESLRDR